MVLRAMLVPDPEKRPSARRVEKCFANAIREIPLLRGEGVPLHCVDPEKEETRRKKDEEREVEKERTREEERKRFEELRKMKAETILSSSSVSEFDFGFSARGSDSETEEDESRGSRCRDESDAESMIIPADQVFPQLSLPTLDLHLRGIEELSIRD